AASQVNATAPLNDNAGFAERRGAGVRVDELAAGEDRRVGRPGANPDVEDAGQTVQLLAIVVRSVVAELNRATLAEYREAMLIVVVRLVPDPSVSSTLTRTDETLAPDTAARTFVVLPSRVSRDVVREGGVAATVVAEPVVRVLGDVRIKEMPARDTGSGLRVLPNRLKPHLCAKGRRVRANDHVGRRSDDVHTETVRELGCGGVDWGERLHAR